MSLPRGSASGPRYPMYKSQQVLYARWAEDGLYYKARVTDLLPETQAYLVVFVDYGNSQVCTAADLMPLDSAVMIKAAPPPLAEDAALLEAQRLARIEERRLALKAEEDARKAVLEEKRRVVNERRNARERLEREEQQEAVEAQRARLMNQPRPTTASAPSSAAPTPTPTPSPPPVAPVAPVAVVDTTSVVPPLAAVATAAAAPAEPGNATPVKQLDSRPAAVESTPRSAAKERKRDQTRRTLAVVGSGGGKVSLAEMKREAQLLTPTSKAAVSTAATPTAEAATPKGAEPAAVEETRREETRRPLVFDASESASAPVTAVAQVAPPPAAAKPAEPAPMTPQQREKVLAAEALEKVRTMREQKQQQQQQQQQREAAAPVVATAGAPAAAVRALAPALATLPIPALQPKGRKTSRGGVARSGGGSEDEEEESSSGSQDDDEGRSLTFSVDGTLTSPPSTTTQILNQLEDSLEDDMAELEALRKESTDMDTTLVLYKQLQAETERLERTATAFASELGDLEAEARALLQDN